MDQFEMEPEKTISKEHARAAKKAVIAKYFAEIMKILGLDLKDPSLCDTPSRVAKMYVDEIFSGLDQDNFPKMMTVPNDMKYNQMLIERNIAVYSVCEHHFVPIVGFAHVAYIPNKHVIGLSKLNRIVQFYMRRPQVQERLTQQIMDAVCAATKTKNVAVCVDAIHYCVKMRGVQDHQSDTRTVALSGVFKTEQAAREEFLSAIKDSLKNL